MKSLTKIQLTLLELDCLVCNRQTKRRKYFNKMDMDPTYKTYKIKIKILLLTTETAYPHISGQFILAWGASLKQSPRLGC